MKVYRFELAFDGRPQNIGFLQGIDEMGLPLKQEIHLLELFDSLPCPKLNAWDPLEFWFTEVGFRTYTSAFREYKQALSETLWDLIFEVKDVSAEELGWAVYQDEYQVCWDRCDMHFNPKNATMY